MIGVLDSNEVDVELLAFFCLISMVRNKVKSTVDLSVDKIDFVVQYIPNTQDRRTIKLRKLKGNIVT